MFLNKESLDLIKMWFRTPQEVSECISTILNAVNDSRQEAIEQLGTHKLNFEDYDDELKERVTNSLRRYFNKMRTTKKGEIKNTKNYLYISMKNLFGYWQNEILINRKDDKKIINVKKVLIMENEILSKSKIAYKLGTNAMRVSCFIERKKIREKRAG